MTSSKYIEYLQNEVEGQLLDRKRASINPKDVAQHISAFANAEGGKLVIGIEDNGEISGFNHSKAKNKEVYIEAPFEHLYRIPKYTHEIIEVKKRDGTMDEILIFDIEPSYDAIITLKDDSVYLRINDKSRKLTHNQITNLEYDRGSRRFEEELVEYSSIEDVDENLVSEFKQLLDTNVDNEKLLKARGFMREGKLTVAGLLLFSNNINFYLPSARIRFMRYEGTKEESGARLNVVKDITFDKALPVAIREARAFINTQLREYTFLGKEGRFVTLPEYPEFAWFEGMINAIIHRRYDNQGFCELSSKEGNFRVVLFNKNYKLNKIPTNQKLTEIVEFLSDGKLASRIEIQETMGLQKSYTSDLIAELKKIEIIGSEGRGLGTRNYLYRG